jgi:hypothetical protein
LEFGIWNLGFEISVNQESIPLTVLIERGWFAKKKNGQTLEPANLSNPVFNI